MTQMMKPPGGVIKNVIPQLLVTTYGNGEIGDKARQLIDKGSGLNEIGFAPQPRYFISQGFIDVFCRTNDLGNGLSHAAQRGVEPEMIIRGKLPDNFDVARKEIVSKHPDWPLMVRSSAMKDARGTGIYKSSATWGDKTSFDQAVLRVIASFFTSAAKTFRVDTNSGNGFGIIIEPMIAKKFDGVYAPIVSGFGYSSTPSGEGYVVAVPGFGGGVETRDGLMITRSAIKSFYGDLHRYLSSLRWSLAQRFQPSRIALLSALRCDYGALAYRPSREGWAISPAELNVDWSIRGINLASLFSMMEASEMRFGGPQYFEWAITFKKGEQQIWALQIADVTRAQDPVDFDVQGEIICKAHSVKGSGIKECGAMVCCGDERNIKHLKEYNRVHNNYVLFFSGGINSAYEDSERWPLTYDAWNNAAVLIETGDVHHKGTPTGHLGTDAQLTGKLFGILGNEYEPSESPLWSLPWDFSLGKPSNLPGSRGLGIIKQPVRVISSERHDRLVVSLSGDTRLISP